MGPEQIVGLVTETVLTIIAMVAVLIVPGMLVGLVVSILQAATQINEMTLSFIPKLIATATALVIAGPWMLKLIVGYTRELFESIPMLIR